MFPSPARNVRVFRNRPKPPGEKSSANALVPGMREELRSHQRLARLAERQHGIVSRRQLLRLGYSKSAIGRAARSGRLHRVHHGVYAVGRMELSDHGLCIAAVAACGPDALLSHGSAAWLWGLLPTCPRTPEVTVPRRGHSRQGIRLHHAPALTDDDRTKEDQIPVTAVPRVLLDLAASGIRGRLERAIRRAEQLGLLDLRAVEALLARTHGHAGAGRLREALGAYREPAFTRSGLERRFLRLVREAGLPRPATNLFVESYELDAYWEHERFAVELDTYEFHGGRVAFEADRKRQEDLMLAGIEVVRITGRRIDREPEEVMERLGRLAGRRRNR